MSKFTPGPWRYGRRDDGSMWLSLGDPVKGPHHQGDLCASDADARLIAAAPAMYKALRNLAAVHECWCGPVGSRTCYRCEALAVLAEVEGK